MTTVLWISSGHRTPNFEIASSNLADLEVAPEDDEPAPDAALPEPPEQAQSALEPSPPQGKSTRSQPITDPAILSVGRPPKPIIRTDSLATATLSGSFNELSLGAEAKKLVDTAELATTEDGDESTTYRAHQAETSIRTKAREKLRPELPEQYGREKLAGQAQKSTRTVARKQDAVGPGLEVSPASKENRRSGKRSAKQFVQSSRRQRAKAIEAQNGWATEDATDIQEGGDFDFEANLSKFDKTQVFKQLKEDDTIAHASRLVGHNRLPPKPGTAGGRNLHWTENVLDSPQAFVNGVWNSEAEASDRDRSDAITSSGRNSIKNPGRSGNRKLSTRSTSGRTESMSADPFKKSTVKGAIHQPSIEVPNSPKSRSVRDVVTSPFPGRSSSFKSRLRIVDSNRVCPCLNPLQMLELEQYAVSAMGLGEGVLIENAGRSIAEAVIKALRLPGQENTQRRFHVVVAAGNHRTGARALAAGRQLRNRGFKVTATILGLDREEDLLEEIKSQATAYRKAGGYLSKPLELLDALKNGGLYPAIVIDALLGVHLVFDDLRTDEQAWYFELVAELNQADATAVAIDVPSGVDASSGEVTALSGNSLALNPYAVVWLGAPKLWLLASLKDSRLNQIPHLFVADIGIANAAWKRLGNRRNRGIDWGTEWVIRLKVEEG